MGLTFGFSSSRQYDYETGETLPTRNVETVVSDKTMVTTGNPNPKNFNILKTHSVGKYTVALIEYPDCHNYEGRKICVFRCSAGGLKAALKIDPHFHEYRGLLVPIARFEPTDFGWNLAIEMIEKLDLDYIKKLQ